MSYLDDVRNAVYRRADRLGFPAWYGSAAGMSAWAAFTRDATPSTLDAANSELARMECDRLAAAHHANAERVAALCPPDTKYQGLRNVRKTRWGGSPAR
jgi:hypothetical protein